MSVRVQPQAVLRGRCALRERLADLQRQVERVQTHYAAAQPTVSSGWADLDRVLDGGLSRGGVHELAAGSAGAAVATVALRAAASAAGDDRWVLYVDGKRELFPPAAAQLGIALDRLLVIHTWQPADALWACEQALRCPAIAVAIVGVKQLDTYDARRLQLAAESGTGMALLLRPGDVAGKTFAATRLRFDLAEGAQDVRRVQVTVLKQRAGTPRGPVTLELPDAPDLVSAPAATGDAAGAARRHQRAG